MQYETINLPLFLGFIHDNLPRANGRFGSIRFENTPSVLEPFFDKKANAKGG